MRPTLVAAMMLGAFGVIAPAATISVIAPAAANGNFDISIQATNLFAGRDPSTDGIISYGFDLTIDQPSLLLFDGATSGPLFDASTAEPGTEVFGAASGFGIFDPVSQPLLLTTLHFTRIGAGSAEIQITSDLSNPFQGLQYLNAPFAQSIAGDVTVRDAVATPEPTTIIFAAVGLVALALLRRYPKLRRLSQNSGQL